MQIVCKFLEVKSALTILKTHIIRIFEKQIMQIFVKIWKK
jgi:hypothetical protein